jgi:hypothetical protein
MKKFRNITLGGIQQKVFNLVLITFLLMIGLFSSSRSPGGRAGAGRFVDGFLCGDAAVRLHLLAGGVEEEGLIQTPVWFRDRLC